MADGFSDGGYEAVQLPDELQTFLKVFIGDRNSDAQLRASLLGQPG